MVILATVPTLKNIQYTNEDTKQMSIQTQMIHVTYINLQKSSTK